MEALAIDASVNHYTPYIIQAESLTHVLTDSKPCKQALDKLYRGQFSTSLRMATFLAAASRYQIKIIHLGAKANYLSDFLSRNAAECSDLNCQICSFVEDLASSVVYATQTSEYISGSLPMPYVSRSAWLQIQKECPDLKPTYAHLTQGTRPTKN